MFNNKHAQIGETLSWIVATAIIIFLLMISIAIVGLGKKEREIENEDKFNLVISKSLIGYLQTDEGTGKINYERLQTMPEGEIEEDLAKKILNLYSSLKGIDFSEIKIADSGKSFILNFYMFGQESQVILNEVKALKLILMGGRV